MIWILAIGAVIMMVVILLKKDDESSSPQVSQTYRPKEYVLFFALLLLAGCSKTINVKSFAMIYEPKESHFFAIDTLSRDTIIVKNGDRLICDTVRLDVDFFEYEHKDFYKKLIEEHSDLIIDETYIYPEDSTIYKYKSVPRQEVVHIKKDSIIRCYYVAGELFLKEVRGTVVGELSGRSFFTTKNAELLGWDYHKNITASTKLSFGESWWGTVCYQLKTEIKNISQSSFDKSVEFKIEGYDKNHNLVGVENASVSDFLLIGEVMSKTIPITDFDKKIIYAEYFRLYIDDVYFGEFLNNN